MIISFIDYFLDEELLDTSSLSPTFLKYDLVKSIGCHLSNLLNTRSPNFHWPKKWQQLATSLVTYGIPDLTNYCFTNETNQLLFCHMIHDIIVKFEPRLHSIRVSVCRKSNSCQRILCLQVHAELQKSSQAIDLSFDL